MFLRQLLFGALFSVISVSCATVETSREFSGVATDGHRDVRTMQVWERRAEAIAVSLGKPAANGISLTEKQVARAEIGVNEIARAVAHENNSNMSAEIKTANLAADQRPYAVDFTLAQNSLSTGGWRKEAESYVHGFSGMDCPNELIMIFVAEDGAEAAPIKTDLSNIQVFDETGNDTACNYENQDEGVYLTIYASKWPDVSVNDHFGASLKLILDRFSVKSEAMVMVASVEADKNRKSTIIGETRAAAYLLEPMEGLLKPKPGSVFKTALWLNRTGDWHVKVRGTFPVSTADGEVQLSIVELVSAVMHATTLNDVDAHINTVRTVDVSG